MLKEAKENTAESPTLLQGPKGVTVRTEQEHFLQQTVLALFTSCQ